MSKYDAAFYADRRSATLHSARTILGLIHDVEPIGSICDVGCGTGTWLTVAGELGTERTVGIEGYWVRRSMLDDPDGDLRQMNLEDPISVDHPVDLAISLEVAEHLSPARADSFVAELCAISSKVLFGAAIPRQGGVGHLNEQWPSYWAAKFREHGYLAYDFVRPSIWSNEAIPHWYRQNTILYVKAGSAPAGLYGTEISDLARLDLVHPTAWLSKTRPITVGRVLRKAAVTGKTAFQRVGAKLWAP